MGRLAAQGGALVTAEFFREQMARLNGLHFRPADLDSHWEGLRDLPDPVLERAVTRAIRTRADFPAPYELRQDADATRSTPPPQEDRGHDLEEPVFLGTLPNGVPIHARREWTFYCDRCNDSGMQAFWCGPISTRYPWMTARRCKIDNCLRTRYEHEWVEACPCAQSNPAVLKRKERQLQYAEKRAKQ